jgi:hypothetical protein
MPTQRSLGLYEKYALAMHGLGSAPAVAVTALLPTSLRLDSTNLLSIIAALLAQESHLRSSVVSPRTTEPELKLNEGIRPESVLYEESGCGNSAEDALLKSMEALRKLDVEEAPLWRVWVYEEDPQTKLRRVVLGIHHLLADGTASKNLFTEFLTILRSPTEARRINPVDATIPPTLEQTIDIRPSTLTLIRTGFAEFIVPKLPAFLRPRAVPFWPNPAIVSPKGQPTAIKLLFLPVDVSSSLATVPKTRQVKTLHPTLATAAIAAVANAVLSFDFHQSIDIKCQTPVSLRSPALGHSLLTSNYVSSISHLVPSITPSYLASTSFWSLARSFANHLRSPSSHQIAKEGIGMLEYIPNGNPSIVLGEGERTSWENWLEKRMDGENPWKSGSFEFSNLGRVIDTEDGVIQQWIEEGMKDVCWAQPASASGCGLQFNVSPKLFAIFPSGSRP